MENLIRLAYVSRPSDLDKGINYIQTVNQQILSTSRAFNAQKAITGILFFGNDCYFQLIEGDKSNIEYLYSKIEKDPRHKDIKLMFKEPIASRSFAGWKMKFIDNIEIARPLINLHGYKHFNPFDFPDNLFKDLIDFLSEKCAVGKCEGSH